MAFVDCKDGLITFLQALTDYFPTVKGSSPVVFADSNVLNQGVNRAAILWPGSVGEERYGGPQIANLWGVEMELYQRYTSETQTNVDFVTMRDAVIREIANNPNIGGVAGVERTTCSSSSPVGEIQMNAKAPVFLSQRFTVTIYQTRVVS